ncbi:MAG: alpha/beta hydrolase [Ilumatobacteraceae bacterium]|nr:alpha/beta hydrolase [Ilumatobacteraceae bacterium]
MSIETLIHNRVRLALHTLREADAGHPLLLLHGLGERSPSEVPDAVAGWNGPITALDFTGHGASTMPVGGGYTAEILMADADAAIQHLGDATIVGRGLGAYIALLIAGARPALVRGVVLADGPGLSGGPSSPTSQPVFSLDPVDAPPDPYALAELGRDLRPPDYATAFSRLAVQGSDLDQPITVVARFRPSWIRAVAGEPGVGEADSIRAGLELYQA